MWYLLRRTLKSILKFNRGWECAPKKKRAVPPDMLTVPHWVFVYDWQKS